MKLEGRIALVTGASRGIGYFAARELAREGAHVIAVARTVGGLEELDDEIKAAGGSATLVPLDLMEHDAIDRLGASIFERWGKLDALLANAAMLGQLSPLGHIDPKMFDKVMSLNVTANWRLIRSLDPLLRQSDAGRALFLTSSVATSARPFWGAYSASKAAMEVLARTWAGESLQTDLKVNVLDPGGMRTAMRAKAMPGENPEDMPHPSEISPLIADLLSVGNTRTGGLYRFKDGAWEDA